MCNLFTFSVLLFLLFSKLLHKLFALDIFYICIKWRRREGVTGEDKCGQKQTEQIVTIFSLYNHLD